MQSKINRLPAFIQKSGLSRSTIYRLIKEDSKFPQPIKLSTRAIGFLEIEVDAWIAGRVEASRVVAL